MGTPLRYRISVDEDLLVEEDRARARADTRVFKEKGLDPGDLRRTLDVLIDASAAEQERETNLNARGAAVAAVGGILVTALSAVAKPVVEIEKWTDWTKIVALILFGAAVFAAAAAAVMAVIWVLRPGRGTGTKNFLGETLVNLWLSGHGKQIVRAKEDRLNLLFLDRCLRTLPAWHFRNRRKARWLRRAWVFLAAGIVGVAAAGAFALARLLEIAEPEDKGTAADIQWWWIPVVLAAFALFSLIAIYGDLVRAGRREKEEERNDRVREIDAIAGTLQTSPTTRHWPTLGSWLVAGASLILANGRGGRARE